MRFRIVFNPKVENVLMKVLTLEREAKNHFRVTIFGSARLKKGSTIYEEVFDLARMISEEGMDIVTGGGPGLMNAASEGHHAGRESETHSIGLRINLPFEQEEATHLDIKKEFNRFSNRLDSFMQFSNVVVVASGGVGTLLELFYTWQLLQVNQICNIPVILLGDMWQEFINWIKKYPLKRGLLDKKDADLLFLARDNKEALNIIRKAYEAFEEEDDNFCLNSEKYGI